MNVTGAHSLLAQLVFIPSGLPGTPRTTVHINLYPFTRGPRAAPPRASLWTACPP